MTNIEEKLISSLSNLSKIPANELNKETEIYGAELIYGEITSWSHPCIHTWDDVDKLKLNMKASISRRLSN